MSASDPFELQRFLTAQAGILDTALQELRAGRKRSHWMWFVFPQLRGLGHSSTAQFFGIGTLEEARAYRAHPVLGPRLAESTSALLECAGLSLNEILGSPDDLKLRSSMTLFDVVEPDGVYRRVLDRWCDGERDPRTLALLGER